MAHCPNGHGEQSGKFCEECGAALVSRPASGDSLRQRSSEARARSDSNTTVNVTPGPRDSALVPLLLLLLLAALAVVAWLLLFRNAPAASDPVAAAVAATLTAQATPVAPVAPVVSDAPDGTATAALATAQAVAQAPSPADAAPTPDSTATAQAIDARVQERVDALLATRNAEQASATAIPTAAPLPTDTPDLDATVQAEVAAALTAQPTATPTPVPSATPDTGATLQAVVIATITAVAHNQPTATQTPNLNATLQAGVAGTVTAVARNRPAATATPNLNATVVARVAATQTARPTATRNATATAAVATAQAVGRQPTVDAIPQAGDTWTNPVDGAVYVYVPAGHFFMGRAGGETDESLHWVQLDGYWIMRTEVTSAQYQACISANACPATINPRAYESGYEDHPVVSLSWSAANAYARWVKGRLPTEAEWEKACRGTDQRFWPWGNSTPEAKLANFGNYVRDTRTVGSYVSGVSPYGAQDMAGNAVEWVADWYAADYYSKSSSHNPTGPEEGTMRVLRGGSYGNTADGIRCTYRNRNLPTALLNTIGFRVVVPYP